MKACFIIKYPPIQGGVSRGGYWMARDLAERGHEIHVVTNSNEVEDDYRIYMDADDREWYEPRFEESGGFVKVRHTQPLSSDFTHIPQSNPFVSKLASAATQVIRNNGCEVIFGYYLQPYVMAAYLASLWTGVPFMIRHAGSDLGRLMKQRDLTTAYREVFKAADCVWTGFDTPAPFLAMGVKEENLWRSRSAPVPRIFSPHARPLDLNALLAKLAAERSAHVRNVLTNTAPIDFSKPTIGIYGKVGEVKGSFDLLSALGGLKREGHDFNLLALTQGHEMSPFKQAVQEHDLQDRTWTFPFIPHWKVPGFIRACHAVCFLERDFPISFHGPNVAKEVLACGTCLILSGEIAEKQVMRDRFRHGENVLIVDDPKEHAELADALRLVVVEPERAGAIGREGRTLLDRGTARAVEAPEQARNPVEALEGRLLALAASRRGAAARAPRAGGTPAHVRKARLKSCLSTTSALLDGKWEQLVERYCLERGDEDAANRFADAVKLCEFIEADLAGSNGNGNGNGCLKDVLLYEKVSNMLYTDMRGEFGKGPAVAPAPAAAFGESPAPPRKFGRGSVWRSGVEQIKQLRPVQAKGVHVLGFDYDVEALTASAARGEVPAAPPRAKTYILFKKELNFIGLQLELSEPLKQLLDLCDGSRTIGEVVADFDASLREAGALQHDEGVLGRDVIAALRELFAKGVVAFV